jgi:TRAP-type mannitol/chloroaromatic compound transport system permease small subunit
MEPGNDMSDATDTSDTTPAQSGPVAMLQKVIDRVALVAAYAAAACLGVLTLLTLGQVACGVLSRFIPGFPSDIPVGWEYSAYLMGTAFMLGGALTLRAGMQIRVQIILRSFGGRFERPLEIVSSAIGAAFVTFLAWSLSTFAFDSFSSGQVSGGSLTPLWIPQASLALGTTIFALQCIMRVVAAVLNEPLVNESFKVASNSE